MFFGDVCIQIMVVLALHSLCASDDFALFPRRHLQPNRGSCCLLYFLLLAFVKSLGCFFFLLIGFLAGFFSWSASGFVDLRALGKLRSFTVAIVHVCIAAMMCSRIHMEPIALASISVLVPRVLWSCQTRLPTSS